jgi:beta-lactamase regulating signal transducer with metallopeptidase domain
MDFLNQSAFLKALGWSLLNSFWQFAVLWILFLFIVYVRKSMTAGLKHALALAFLITGFLWFGAGLSYRYFAYSEIPGFNEGSLFLNDAGIVSGAYFSLAAFLDNNLSYISAIYLLIVASLFLKFFRYFYYTHKIQTKGLTKIKAGLRMFVEQLAMKLEIRKKVNVWLSEYVDTPIIIGFLKPTILIPFACMNQLTIPQLEAVILHELAHIKRNDYLLNLFIAITEIVFFFNPFSRLFTRTIQQERENSCDDWVLQFKFDRYDYASALLSLEKSRSNYIRLSVPATGVGKNKTLLTRVKRIMEVKVNESTNGVKLFAYMLSVALLTFVAFINPGDLVISKITKEFPAAAPILYPPTENHISLISNTSTVPPTVTPAITKEKTKSNPVKIETVEIVEEEPAPGNEDMFVFNVADLAFEGADYTTKLIAAVKEENRDFSMTDYLQPIVPETPATAPFPFVPSTSFSYVFVDTSKPRVKAESYYEKNARESLVKAKKAVQQIDWEKIEKQLDNKVDIKKLRKEIEKSLEELNWQEINEEVKLALAAESSERMKMLKQEAEELNRYRTQQMNLKQLENEIQVKRDLYRTNIQRQQQEIEALLDEHNKLEAQNAEAIKESIEKQQQELQAVADAKNKNQKHLKPDHKTTCDFQQIQTKRRSAQTDATSKIKKEVEKEQEVLKRVQQQKSKPARIIVHI